MMKIDATHWIVGVRHCVEWPDGKWIFIQDVKVCVILEKKKKMCYYMLIKTNKIENKFQNSEKGLYIN